STRSPRRSVALPFPSSPHWAPTITTAGMATPGERCGTSWTLGHVRCTGPRGSYQAARSTPWTGPVPSPAAAGSGRPAAACPDPCGPLRDTAAQGAAAVPPSRQGPSSAEQAGIGLAQERGDAIGLGVVAEAAGGLPQHRECAQEAAVRGVGSGDGALAAPSGLAQRVQSAVVAGAGVGVGGDVVAVGERVLGEGGPGERGVEVARGDLPRVTVVQLL